MSFRRAAIDAPCRATLLAISTPVLSHSSLGQRAAPASRPVHAHEIGADQAARRASRRQPETPQADLRRRQGRSALARAKSPITPSSSQGLAASRLLRQPPSRDAAMQPGTGSTSLMGGRLRRNRGRRLVLRHEILRRRRARCSRRPSDKPPAVPCPSCHGPAGFAASAIPASWHARDCSPAALPLNRLQIRLNRNTICATPTIKRRDGDELIQRRRGWRDEGRFAQLVIAARHAEQPEIVHREEDRIGAEEGDPEVELAERLVEHSAGDLRIPMIDRRRR